MDYKLQLLINEKIDNISQIIIMRVEHYIKRQINKLDKLLKLKTKFNTLDKQNYNEKAICDNKVYAKNVVG